MTQIHRQPGSAFKPFVYTVALDNGYPPCYEVLNQPVTIPMPDCTRWTPENFERDIGGKYTLSEALKHSINLVTVRDILEIAPGSPGSNVCASHGHHIPHPGIRIDCARHGGGIADRINVGVQVFMTTKASWSSPIAITRIEDKRRKCHEEDFPDREKGEILERGNSISVMTVSEKGIVNSGTGTRVRSYFTGACAGKPAPPMIMPMPGLWVSLRD